jgi:penicillin-binding protein 1C
MKGTSGVTGAGPIFHDVMLAATKHRSQKEFERPQGIIDQSICRLSGKLPTPLCPHTIIEHFVAGTEPKDPDTMHQEFPIDRRNGLRAGEACDDRFVIKKIFTVFPKDVERWARENGFEEAPRSYSPLCGVANSDASMSAATWIEIIKPLQSDSFQLDPLIPDAHEKIILEALAGDAITTVDWYVDGKKVGLGKRPNFRFEWKPTIGTHVLEAKNGSLQTKITIEVLP